MIDPRKSLERFEALPRRLFLDSSTLQTLLDYGGFIWENETLEPTDPALQIPGFTENLEALRAIFKVNERAMFDIVISDNSLREVHAKRDAAYLQWAHDVLEHWLTRIEEYRGGAFHGEGVQKAGRIGESRFGYLSDKDRLLIQDALLLECDAFITMEGKLPKNARHLATNLNLRVLRPLDYWTDLRPWAGLYC